MANTSGSQKGSLLQQQQVLFVGLNQDHSCFGVGTTLGFFVLECDPVKERFHRDLGGGIGIVECLFKTNIVALVGGGPFPKFSPDKVILWDDFQSKPVAELELRSPVTALKLTRECIFVAVEQRVFIYSFFDLSLQSQIETQPNPQGLCEVSGQYMVSVGLTKGTVLLFSSSDRQIIPAHKKKIQALALSLEGNLLATSAGKGKARVWDTRTRTLLVKLKEGSIRNDTLSLCFDRTGKTLGLTTKNGTCLVFNLNKSPDASSWNLARFDIAEALSVKTHSICFGSDSHSVIFFSSTGRCYKYAILEKATEKTGATQRLSAKP